MRLEVEMGISLLELLPRFALEGELPFLAAYVNNRIKELNFRIFKPLTVVYIGRQKGQFPFECKAWE